MKLKLALAVAVIMLAATVLMACPSSVLCPAHDGTSCYFTGTKTIGGHLFGVYHCPAGDHDVLARCD